MKITNCHFLLISFLSIAFTFTVKGQVRSDFTCENNYCSNLIFEYNWGGNNFDTRDEILELIYPCFECDDEKVRKETKNFLVRVNDTFAINLLISQLEKNDVAEKLKMEAVFGLFGLSPYSNRTTKDTTIYYKRYVSASYKIIKNENFSDSLKLTSMNFLDARNNLPFEFLSTVIWDDLEEISTKIAAFDILLNGNNRKKHLISQLDSLWKSKSITNEFKGEMLLSLGKNFDYLMKYVQLTIQEQAKIQEVVEYSIQSTDAILLSKAIEAKILIENAD